MKALIVTGGFIDDKFTLDYIGKEIYDVVFAVDRGLSFFARTGLRPDYIVGDFDSVEEGMLRPYLRPAEDSCLGDMAEVAGDSCLEPLRETEQRGDSLAKVIRLNPRKDDTDTEHAFQMAIELGCTCIHLFGATGTRLDHVLGNLQLLGYGLPSGVQCLMIDPCNRIRLINGETVLNKETQFGTYVSLIPYTPQVTGLTLEGFEYPLKDYTMSSFYVKGAAPISGISNEIREERARITMKEGILVLVESRDEERT